MPANRNWDGEELILLLAFYFRFPRASHTDSHIDCQKLAHVLKRTPGAVDQQLRNIDFDLVRQTGDRHTSQRLGELLDQYKDNLRELHTQANKILETRKWKFARF